MFYPVPHSTNPSFRVLCSPSLGIKAWFCYVWTSTQTKGDRLGLEERRIERTSQNWFNVVPTLSTSNMLNMQRLRLKLSEKTFVFKHSNKLWYTLINKTYTYLLYYTYNWTPKTAFNHHDNDSLSNGKGYLIGPVAVITYMYCHLVSRWKRVLRHINDVQRHTPWNVASSMTLGDFTFDVGYVNWSKYAFKYE